MTSIINAIYSYFYPSIDLIVPEIDANANINENKCWESTCTATAPETPLCKQSNKCAMHCTDMPHDHCRKFKCTNNTNLCPLSGKCPRHCIKKEHNHCSNIYCFAKADSSTDYVCGLTPDECPGLKIAKELKKCVHKKCDSSDLCCASNDAKCEKHCCKPSHLHCKKINCKEKKCSSRVFNTIVESDFCEFHCLDKTHRHCAFFCSEDKVTCAVH